MIETKVSKQIYFSGTFYDYETAIDNRRKDNHADDFNNPYIGRFIIKGKLTL